MRHTERSLRDQVGNEEPSRRIGEIIANQLEVFPYPHHSSILPESSEKKKKPLCEEEGVAYIEHHLVEKLQDIAAKHKGDNAKVDLASQGRKINSRLILDIGMFIQIIQGIITSSMDRMGVYIWSFLGHSGDRKTTGKKKKRKKKKKQRMKKGKRKKEKGKSNTSDRCET
jgi:hypothetical protein